FHLPVIIDNEANAGAYGEKRFGAGKNFENLIYVSAGIGIGVGFILQNSLYRGAEGFSGEMGHMVIDIDGIECRCGSKG
ncbi:ROK family protein, partial [Escherichia coli]|nr:ROK family protein [Escherichia coli]